MHHRVSHQSQEQSTRDKSNGEAAQADLSDSRQCGFSFQEHMGHGQVSGIDQPGAEFDLRIKNRNIRENIAHETRRDGEGNISAQSHRHDRCTERLRDEGDHREEESYG